MEKRRVVNIMKKVIFIFMAIIGTFVMMISSSAAHYWNNDIRFTAAYGTIKVDGTVDAGEWDDAEAIEMKLVGDTLAAKGFVNYQGGWEAEANRKTTDYQGTYKIKWDENYIYFLEIRIDDKVNLNGNATAPWTTDGTLIFVQAPDDNAATNPDGVVQNLFYSVGKDGKIGGDMKVRVGKISTKTQEIVDIAGGSIASTQTSNGFIVEFAVPWSMFKSQVSGFTGVKAGDIMGISYVVHDSDNVGATGYEKQFCYAVDNAMLGTMPVNYDYGGWGTLELLAQVITEEVAAEVPAESAPVTQTTASVTPAGTSAPQTADVIGIAVVMAMMSGMGLIIKKRK